MNKNLLLLSVSALCAVSVAEAAKKPNIIFILADDMGYGDIQYYDAKSKIATPFLDKMAREGVAFKDAHTSSSVSTPTRYGILTGRYNWRSSLKSGVLSGYSPALIASDRSTVASMLKSAGYATAMFGKWHLGMDWQVTDGKRASFSAKTDKDNVDYTKKVKNGISTRGFEYSFAFNGSLDMPPYVWVENDMPTQVPTKVTVSSQPDGLRWRKGPTADNFSHEMVLPEIIERSSAYIKQKSKEDKPFFIYLPLPAPHTPIIPIKEYQGRSGIGSYGDFVIMVDDMVGKLFAALKQAGCDDNTLVVFTTDNGCSPAASIPALHRQGHYPNSIYRGHKADLFDGGHRIPCIVRYPDGFGHKDVENTICLTDFYATFAEIAGYKLKDNEAEDSFSLVPLLTGKKEKSYLRDATVHHSIQGDFTIRRGEWKLLLSPHSGGWSAPKPSDKEVWAKLPAVQLYNMKTDPSEKVNVQDKHPEIVKELTDLLTKYITDGRTSPGKPQTNDGEKTWKQLHWLQQQN